MPPVPTASRWQDLISMNSTAIEVRLYAWLSGGCPLLSYAVSYKLWSEANNKEVANKDISL